MYQIGETVMYPGTGVCRITDIVRQKFMRGEEKTYYVLKAVFEENSGTTIYCPVDSEAVRLRPLLNREDIQRMLQSAPRQESLWVDNDTQRKKTFSAILKEGDQVKTLRMLMDIHHRQNEKQSEGKRLHAADEKIMQEAQKLLHQELACSLKMTVDDAEAFILRELKVEV